MPVGVGVASLGMSALSFGSGRKDAKAAQKLQEEQLALQREQLAFAKQRYSENQALYGETRQKLVDAANEGVDADLQGATNRASADVAQSFEKSQGEVDRNLARFGINPNSGRAMAARAGQGVAKAAAESGLINVSRRNEKRYADDTTWNRREAVGRMGTQELQFDASNIGNSSQQLAQGYGNAASGLRASAGAAYQTAGQFAGMGLSSLANYKPAPSVANNPSAPTYMYPVGSTNGPAAPATTPDLFPKSPYLAGITYP